MKKKLFVWLLTMGIITSGFCVNIDAMDMDLMTLSPSESSSTMISSEEGVSVLPEAPPGTPTPSEASFHLSYQSESLKWENHTTVSQQFSVTGIAHGITSL
nr:hypothetical protein [uncultured Blautia sp.]